MQAEDVAFAPASAAIPLQPESPRPMQGGMASWRHVNVNAQMAHNARAPGLAPWGGGGTGILQGAGMGQGAGSVQGAPLAKKSRILDTLNVTHRLR